MGGLQVPICVGIMGLLSNILAYTLTGIHWRKRRVGYRYHLGSLVKEGTNGRTDGWTDF